MKNFKFFMQSLTMIAMIAFVSISITSCGDDDPVSGCTDPDADNENAMATEDDGTCTYFDRFVGEWVGTFDCPGALDTLFTSADLSITESVSTTGDQVSVVVQSSRLPVPVPTFGTITKDKLIITRNLPGIELDLLEIVPGPETYNIDVNGELTLSADGNSLSGTVTISLEEIAFIFMTLADDCSYTAMKQ